MSITGSSVQPRVLFISDTRDSDNWGSRATSAALLELLMANGLTPEVSVGDAEVRRTTPMTTFMPLDRAMANTKLAATAAAAVDRGERSRALLRRLVGMSDAVFDDPVESVAAWRSRRRQPFLRWNELVENADLMIINGEGSMIFTTRSRREQRFHLALMQLALEKGVRYAYVNALVSDPPTPERNERTRRESTRLLLSALCVTTRDEESATILEGMDPIIPAKFVPDAVFTWFTRVNDPTLRRSLDFPELLKPYVSEPERLGDWRFDRPYLCIGGTAPAAHDQGRALESYGHLVRRLSRLGLPIYLTASASGDAFLERIARDTGLPFVPPATNVWAAAVILANAAAVITGRYHPSIMAGLGGAPAVMLGSDSHKTASVQRLLGYPDTAVFPAFPDELAADAIARRVQEVLAERSAWQMQIYATVKRRAAQAAELGPLLTNALKPAAA